MAAGAARHVVRAALRQVVGGERRGLLRRQPLRGGKRRGEHGGDDEDRPREAVAERHFRIHRIRSLIHWTPVVLQVALKQLPVVPDARDLLDAVFADRSRHGIPSDERFDFCLVRHVNRNHLVDPAVDLHAHARIPLDVRPIPLGLGEVSFQPEVLLAAADIERVAAWGWVDDDGMGDAVPGARLQHDGVAPNRIVDLVDPVPVRDGFTYHLSAQPQSGIAGSPPFHELVAACRQIGRVEAGQAQSEERQTSDTHDQYCADLQYPPHYSAPGWNHAGSA